MGIHVLKRYPTRGEFVDANPSGTCELVCEYCSKPLGMLRTGPVGEEIFVENGAILDMDLYEFIMCRCGRRHEFRPYLER